MICHKYRCIYVRIAKTGSTSISHYFIKYLGGRHEEKLWTLPLMQGRGLTQIINLFPTYFIFTFVRNPFDRFVSTWSHKFDLERVPGKKIQYHSLREYAELATDFFAHSEAEPGIISKRIGPHGVKFSEFLYWDRAHLRPQKEFLLDYNPDYYFGERRFNNAPCSFIGRYENLEEDFGILLDILGAPFSYPFLSTNISHSRFSKKQKIHYSRYYDKESRRLVQDLYAPDLDALGYEFEDESSVSVLNPLYDIERARKEYKEGIKLSLGDRLRIFLKRLITAIYIFTRIMTRRFWEFLPKRLMLSNRLSAQWYYICRKRLKGY